jgi:hypothetical protein
MTLAVVACGGDGGSQFGNGGNGDSTGYSGGSANNPGNINLGNPGGGVNDKCAESTAKAQLVPVYLVFMIDRSGSMSQDSKWPTITQGLEAFFADPASAGLYASLAFFKQNNECDPNAYAAPALAMTALPSNAFSAAIGNYSPNGGTPTVPAIQGAILYAQTQVPLHPGSKVAIVLATDGIPNDCNSTVAGVAAASATVASTIPTYVIGVGPEAANLDAMAVGGGTGKSYIVTTGNPAQTATDFQNALASIRGKTLACDFQIPPPPAGKTLDVTKVNVVYTPAGGQAQTLSYSKDCVSGTGWHYDNPASPSRIILCQSSCTTAQAGQGASIDIVFGCDTNGGVQR